MSIRSGRRATSPTAARFRRRWSAPRSSPVRASGSRSAPPEVGCTPATSRTPTHRGYLYLVDRKKDLIISGGQNIYPSEIERVLHELAGVAQVAVVGAGDPVYGERVVAFVVRGGEVELEADDVIAHCRAELASYKKPSQVVFVDDLPKTITGKIKKPELRALL